MKCVALLLLLAATCASAQYYQTYQPSPFYGSYYNPYLSPFFRKRRAAEEQLTRGRRSAPAPAPATAADDQQADEATLFYSSQYAGYSPSYYSSYNLPAAYSYPNTYSLPYLRKKRDLSGQQGDDQQADEATLFYSSQYAGYSPSYYSSYNLPATYSYPNTYSLPYLRKKRDLSGQQGDDQQADEATLFYSSIYSPQAYQHYGYSSPYVYFKK